jgi:hypothetical protein
MFGRLAGRERVEQGLEMIGRMAGCLADMVLLLTVWEPERTSATLPPAKQPVGHSQNARSEPSWAGVSAVPE